MCHVSGWDGHFPPWITPREKNRHNGGSPLYLPLLPNAKGRLWKLCEIIQILQMKSGSWRLTIGVLPKKPRIELPFQRSPFTVLSGIGIRPFETVREPGGSPWHLTPKNENWLLLVLKPSQAVISGSSKPGRWHFILGPLGRDRISQGEHLHSAQYREVVNCLYGPTSPGRARRHLWVKTLHPGGGKKNTKKIKREKYRIKWKLPTHLMD